jgi:hypothetical protein
MKEIICYLCEMCNECYKNKEEALKCESIGKEEQLIKINDIVTYKYSISGFDCEAEIKIVNIIDTGHFLVYKFMSRLEDGWEDGLYGKDEIWGNRELLKRIKGLKQ